MKLTQRDIDRMQVQAQQALQRITAEFDQGYFRAPEGFNYMFEPLLEEQPDLPDYGEQNEYQGQDFTKALAEIGGQAAAPQNPFGTQGTAQGDLYSQEG